MSDGVSLPYCVGASRDRLRWWRIAQAHPQLRFSVEVFQVCVRSAFAVLTEMTEDGTRKNSRFCFIDIGVDEKLVLLIVSGWTGCTQYLEELKHSEGIVSH